jgi:hypothetical protein
MSIKRSRTVDHLGFIRQTLRELAGYSTLAFELIQNADDTDEAQRATRLRFDIRDEALWVEDDGGFTDCGDQDLSPDECLFYDEHEHMCDFHSFRLPWGADKRLRDDTTGVFGIGFTAVYQITDRPEIISGTRCWVVDETAGPYDRISEDPVEPPHEGTRIILPWARDSNSLFRRKVGAAAVPEDAKNRLRRALEESLPPAMLFLRHLQQIELALDGHVIRVFTREADGDEIVIKDGRHNRLLVALPITTTHGTARRLRSGRWPSGNSKIRNVTAGIKIVSAARLCEMQAIYTPPGSEKVESASSA